MDRAGRVGPGHCYRCYSAAVYQDRFREFALPELQKIPMEEVTLRMKALHLGSLSRFPFPSPPSQLALTAAAHSLISMGALSPPSPSAPVCETERIGDRGRRRAEEKQDEEADITSLGECMARFPVAPRLSKVALSVSYLFSFFLS